jgi:hypothetical protein
MGPTTFGAAAVAASTSPYALDVAPDGQAFTLTYLDYQAEINNRVGAPRDMLARWEWFVLPLTDHPQGEQLSLAVSGYAITTAEAAATLLISVNGVLTEHAFGPGTDDEFVRPVAMVTSGFDTRLRVAVGVVVESADAQAAASVTVTAVDAEFRS